MLIVTKNQTIRTRKIKLRGYNANIYANGNPGENNSGYIGTSMNIRNGKIMKNTL